MNAISRIAGSRITNIIKGVAIMGIIASLFGCGSPKLETYADLEPKMDIKEFFDGNIKAWGVIQNRSGEVTSRFDADLVGSWEGNQGTLEEVFHYYEGAKGKTENRTWHITRIDAHHFTGTAGDVVGTAKGEVRGNAVNWSYVMEIPVGDSTYEMTLDDWMFNMRDGVVVNRIAIKKFGFTVSEIILFMQKQP